MNTVARRFLFSSSKKTLTLFLARSAHWNKDWIPGPYPETKEQRDAAAKKYGLLPEEYEPYPDDGLNGRGDYPKLKIISADSRDPYYPYEYPELRLGFGEVLHAHSDIMGEDRCDLNIDEKLTLTKTKMLSMFLGTVGGSLLLTWMCKDTFIATRPVLARHYPGDGPHYKY
uniref:NADH dehydrogenase [ubiquinone] 1 beta subcomplex subunit 8, mitochondrial n=1 Tax=Clastoptera arizonana TaxID=38151 RepID=A0A1B6DQG4_9HEMI